MATETTAVELITRDSNSDAWSLGCDITIEEMDVVIEEIKLNDIAIAGIVKTDGISVNIDHSNNNIMDLDINVVIDGLNSSILESQVVPYGKVLTITEISTEATYEKGYAASAFSAKKIYDFVSALSNDVKTNKGGIDRLFRDIANILEIINSGGSGGSGGTGDGYWELDAATGDITTNRQVVIKNNLIVHGDTTSTSAGTDPGTSSVIIGVSVNGKEYSYDYINNGILDLSDAFNNIGNLSDYYTKKEIDNKLEGYFEKNDFSRYQSWWDSLINLITKDGDNIKINTNLIVSGDTSSTAQGTNQGSTGIDEQQLQEYLDNNKYITSSYTYSKQEVDDKFSSIDVSGQINAALSGYAKLDDVDSKIDNLNLSQYAKATDLVNLTTRVKAEEDITATYKSWWDDLKSLIVKDGTNNIKINGNLIVAGDTSTGGTGSNPEVAGTLIGIKVNGQTYNNPVNGILTIPDYPTSLEWSAINGKPTKLTEFTNDAGFITSSALNGYAKTSDLPTKSSLGLGNVENKSSATIRGEITSANVTNALGYTPANNASLANYLPLSGGTISGTTSSPLRINTTATNENGINFLMSGASKAWVGYTPSTGAYIYESSSGQYICVKNGTPYYGTASSLKTLIHSGNIGSQYVAGLIKSDGNAYVSYNATYGYVNVNGVAIGLNSNTIERVTSGKLYIQKNVTEATIINQYGGNVGIGTDSPKYKFDVNGTTRSVGGFKSTTISIECDSNGNTSGYSGEINRLGGGQLWIQGREGGLQLGNADSISNFNGAVTMASGLTVNGNAVIKGDTSSGSDIRFKDKITDHRIALSDIAEAPLFTFKWNDREDDSVHLGSSAQYWEGVAPWLVKGEDFKTLDYSTLGVAIGISLANKTLNLEDRVKILEDKVKALEAENRRLRYGS